MYSRFVELLQKHNVTAYKVSQATGISNGSLSDWKSGRSKPKYESLVKIADYFGVSVDYLLGKEERNIYITGNPGTGKSTIITQSFDAMLQEKTKKLPASNEEFIEMLRQHNKGKAQIFFCGADGEVIELTPEEGAAFKNIVELRKKNKTD